MKKMVIALSIALHVVPITTHGKAPAFTHSLTPGRWGDQVLSYAQLLWLAYKHHVDLYYRAHPVFALFKFSTTDPYLTDDIAASYHHHVKVNTVPQLPTPQPDTLYELLHKIIDYSSIEGVKAGRFTQMVWGDPEFQALLKDKLHFISPPKTPELPHDAITVAVHIRKPSGGQDVPLYSEQIYAVEPTDTSPERPSIITDQRYSDTNDHVLKFVPEQYYIDHLRLIAESVDGPLYVRLFTDSEEPEALAQRIEQAVNNPNVTVTYQDNGTTERACDQDAVVQDWYDMTHYDFLIRSESNFSKTAQLIGQHVAAMYPTSTDWKGKKLRVKEACGMIRNTEAPYVESYSLPQQIETFKTRLRSVVSALQTKRTE